MTDLTPQPAGAADAEEHSRADIYGLLARLWIAPPDHQFLRQLQAASPEPAAPGGHLDAPWRALIAAMRATSVEATAQEYEALFEGVGKPELFLYGSYYLAGLLNERPLVRLRTDLQELGLARDTAMSETEDHIAFLYEVMRYLILGEDVAVCNLERQRRFYREHLQPWIERLCDAVEAHPRAVTWRAVAGLTRAFMQVETQAFDMLEA
jgi:TorA maturation chaperone TorD